MTPLEQQQNLDEAVALLKATTVGYRAHSPAWEQNKSTKWWQALDRIRQVRESLGEPPEPPPPSSGRIWPAPTLQSPLTIELRNTARTHQLDPAKDYIVRCVEPITAGTVTIIGGRHLSMIGGEIVREQGIVSPTSHDAAYGFLLKGQTGTVDLAAWHIHGKGIGQAIVLDQSKGATIQLQKCRIETMHPVGYVHTDGIQTWRGPRILRLGNVTIRTAGVGLQVQPSQFEAQALGTWEYRHVSIEQTTADAYALWKNRGLGALWPCANQNVWVKNLGYLAWADADSPNGSGIRGWNPGGAYPITGDPWRIGLPPVEFAPVASVGVGKTV